MGQDSTGMETEPQFNRTYRCPTCGSDGSCINREGRCEFAIERQRERAERVKEATAMAKRINSKVKKKR